MGTKVIFLVNAICSRSFGGGDMYYIEMAKRCLKEGIDMIFVTSSLGQQVYSRIGLSNVEYLISDMSSRELSNPLEIIFRYVYRAFKTIKIIRKFRLDDPANSFVVTSNSYCDTLTYPFIHKTKVLPVIHMPPPNPVTGYINKIHPPSLREIHYYINFVIGMIMIKAFLSHVQTTVITISKQNKDILQNKFGLGNYLIKIIPNGINIPYEKESLNDIVRGKNIDFVWIGRNHPQKGIDDLKKIMLIFKKKLKKFTMYVIGDVKDVLTDFIKENHLYQNIKLTGVLDNVQKYTVLRNAKIMLFTSHFESFGIVVLENMIVGNSVIGYDIPSSVQNFGRHISYIKSFNYSEFAQKAINYLREYPAMSKINNNYQFARKYSWDSTYAEFRKLIT